MPELMETRKIAGILYPLVLVFQGALGYLQLLDALELVYYPTINRITLTKTFNLGFDLVIPLTILFITWIGYMTWKKKWRTAIFAIILILPYLFYGKNIALSLASIFTCVAGLWTDKTRSVRQFTSILLSLLSGLNLLSFIPWAILSPFGLGSYFKGFSILWLELFYVHSYITPLVALSFLFLWIFNSVLRNLGKKADKQIFNEKEATSASKVIIILSLILAFYSVVYPYLSQINSKEVNIGVDMKNYIDTLENVEAEPSQIFNISRGSKPLIFLALFGFKRLTGLSTLYTVRYFPMLLNTALVVSIYYLGYELTNNSEIASFAAFFTSTGFLITVGMYSYYLANVLGLILVTFSLGLLFRALRRDCKYCLGGASILSFLLVFTHPWTLDHYLASLAITFGLIWYRDRNIRQKREELKMIAIYLGVTIIAELLKMASGGLGGVGATSTVFGSIESISQFWYSTIFIFRFRYGGFLSNLIILGPALVGHYYYSFKGIADDYFRWFLVLTSLVFLFSNEAIKSRLLFNIPFGLYAAMGLEKVSIWIDQRVVKVFAITYSMAYLFMCLSNLV